MQGICNHRLPVSDSQCLTLLATGEAGWSVTCPDLASRDQIAAFQAGAQPSLKCSQGLFPRGATHGVNPFLWSFPRYTVKRAGTVWLVCPMDMKQLMSLSPNRNPLIYSSAPSLYACCRCSSRDCFQAWSSLACISTEHVHLWTEQLSSAEGKEYVIARGMLTISMLLRYSQC